MAGQGPWITLCPGAGRPEKLWPIERFAALARTLTADGPLRDARILAVGAPGEEPLSAALAATLGPDRVVDVVGRESLLVQAACVARTALYVGNDSGFTHIAAALGVPTVGVFGPTDPRQYAPYGPHATHAGGTGDGPARAIEDIAVDEVRAAIERLPG
jgi:ADP-heptose:LPS heptosyltransferase